MIQNINPLFYLLGATTTICTTIAIPTYIIEKRENKKNVTKSKRNRDSNIANSSKHGIDNICDWSVEENIKNEKREKKSYFLDLTPYDVKEVK